ncbi:putative lipase [Triangularia setosa]|uniref:Lipase n=1 Tax=Triangularia setosa TaxID=2587417 RepID=A0AAN6W2C0_9PEZI|nr:putative lipase [Podospora setosa]
MLSTASLLIPIVLANTALATPCQSTIEQHAQVRTSSGLITGHTAPNTGCVIEFLGIPYAKPPIGDLRFAPPQKLLTPDLSYNASSFGHDCPSTPSKPVNYPGFTPQAQRIINYFASATGTPQSEDCLTLNIWTSPSSPRRPKPVLVFFYGGRFTIGNTNTPFYYGAHLASTQREFVIVTVNYRLNIFGFPGAPSLPSHSQNLGLRDQRLAVEWVRDNIPSFHGDPSKITLAGQSSGGVSVDYWAYAYPNDPIAHGLIAHSGTAFSFPSNTKSIQQSNWDSVVSALSCSPTHDPISCMQKIPWQTLLSAASALKPAYAQGVIPTKKQVDSFLLESFTCPVLYQAKGRRDHGVPAFVYRYFADWENTRLYWGSGAYHGVDLHMVFGGAEEVSGGLVMSKEQRGLMGWVQGAWRAFADNPWDGLRKVGWPRFDTEGKTLAEVVRREKAMVEFVEVGGYEGGCEGVTMGALGVM